MPANKDVLVYGAYGHTGRFVVDELLRRGWRPVLSGRDAGKLAAVAQRRGGLTLRPAAIEDADALSRAAEGCVALLNCAGPFGVTAPPLIEVALRQAIPYLDVTGEPDVAAATFDAFDARARAAGGVVIPAAAFFGGLPDLLTGLAMGDWTAAETVSVAFALDGWKPTPGTRAAMAGMSGGRPVFADGRLQRRTDPAGFAEHAFPSPAGRQTVMVDYPGCEAILIPRHVATANVSISMAVAALKDLRDPQAGGPTAVDARGRSDQTFLVEVQVLREGQVRSAWASGRDIYAVTAPILVTAMTQVLSNRSRRLGVVSAGAAFDAAEFLESLAPDGLAVQVDQGEEKPANVTSRRPGPSGSGVCTGSPTMEGPTRWT